MNINTNETGDETIRETAWNEVNRILANRGGDLIDNFDVAFEE